jgi:predicted RNase H-like nuclease
MKAPERFEVEYIVGRRKTRYIVVPTSGGTMTRAEAKAAAKELNEAES